MKLSRVLNDRNSIANLSLRKPSLSLRRRSLNIGIGIGMAFPHAGMT